MKRRVTIQEVASQLGVSTATVSRVLSGSTDVSDRMRRRVEKGVEELGYQPNGLARALRRERTQLVGLIVPDVRSEFFASSTAVLHAALEEYGYRVLLGVSQDDPAVDRDYLAAMTQHGVDGLVHVPCTDAGAAFLENVAGSPPVVELNRRSAGRHADRVTSQSRAGTTALVRHLVDLGHRRILLVAGHPAVSTTRDRMEGFKNGAEACGLTEDETRVASREYSVEWGYEATKDALEEAERPTAVIASSTQLVAGALQATADYGLRVPQELSIAGFDDPAWYRALQPTITTYSEPLEQMGLVAADLLQRRMRGDSSSPPIDVTLEGELVIRSSTGPVPA